MNTQLSDRQTPRLHVMTDVSPADLSAAWSADELMTIDFPDVLLRRLGR